MDKDRIVQNLTCVDGHFHSEAENDIEAALELYTDAADSATAAVLSRAAFLRFK